MNNKFVTREGCEISFEKVGANGFGLTIKQKDGKSATYACGQDEAREISYRIHSLLGKLGDLSLEKK